MDPDKRADAGDDLAFPDALRRAVADSGLSLRQLSDRMQLMGHDLSVATLSYWQSGARTPSRRSSLAAIGDLEHTLGVPRGELASRLAADRSRRDGPRVVGVEELRPEQHAVSGDPVEFANTVLARWGLRWDERVRRLALHTMVRLDASSRPVLGEVREVKEVVGTEPADRLVTAHQYEDPGVHVDIVPVAGCTLGRVESNVDLSITVAELLIPTTPPEATFLCDYEVHYRGPTGPATYVNAVLPTPLRELALEVAFEPDHAPRSVRQVTETSGQITTRHVDVSPEGLVSLLLLDFGPGKAGMYWEVDPEQTA